MKPSSRALVVRWIILAALAISTLAATRCGVLVYFIWKNEGISIYRPISAEAVSRQAAPFQNDTKEVAGLFKIVQRQYGELDLMYGMLETQAQAVWGLAVLGTLAFATLSILLASSAYLLRPEKAT